MIRHWIPTTLFMTAAFFGGPWTAVAETLKSAGDCVVGKRVVTSDGHKGKITRVDRAWSYCYVLQDDTGKEVSYLYSLLETEGSGAQKDSNSNQLIIGKYNCWVGH